MMKLRLSFVVLASCAMAAWSSPPAFGEEPPVNKVEPPVLEEAPAASDEEPTAKKIEAAAGDEETAPSHLPGEQVEAIPSRRAPDPFGLRTPLAAVGRHFGDSVTSGYESPRRRERPVVCLVVPPRYESNLLDHGISRFRTWNPFAPVRVEEKGFAGFNISCGVSK